MNHPSPTINVKVDATNPGQFFACCGLLELADRLWPNPEGWFRDDDRHFMIAATGTLTELVDAIVNAEMTAIESADPYSTPIQMGAPFRPLAIDWWKTDQTGARDLKVWAGTMESFGIADAMRSAMNGCHTSSMFDRGTVVTTSHDPSKKKEPYYFDARRAPNAHSRDVGFAPNDLGMTSIAHPAVEFLCLVGLQAARPAKTMELRVYDYSTWHVPLAANLLLAAATGNLGMPSARTYRFENWFRTSQKKHKAFRPALLIHSGGSHDRRQ